MIYLVEQSKKNLIEIDIYCDMMFEWIKNMKHLGSCCEIGFKDLREKANWIL